VTELGRQRFGGADVPVERRLADLENTLTLIKLDPAENVPLLAPLLDMPLPKERALTVAPEELRGRQFAALISLTVASAKVQPVVLVFEDLHWADPTTLDVLRGLAERGALAPLFSDGAAGVPVAVEHPVASQYHLARAARPLPGTRHGG
jgi:predicted ATPase